MASFIVLADGSLASWNGSAWVAGAASWSQYGGNRVP
jgi:hypothetical protein